MNINRQTLQMLTTKLDTCAITVKEAKAYLVRAKVSGVDLAMKAHTKEVFLRQLAKSLNSEST